MVRFIRPLLRPLLGPLLRPLLGFGLFLTLSSLLAVEGSAMIAPFYMRVNEFAAVLSVGNDAAVELAGQKLVPRDRANYGLIERIERLKDGTFRIAAGSCFIPVSLKEEGCDDPQPMPGCRITHKASLGDVHCEYRGASCRLTAQLRR